MPRHPAVTSTPRWSNRGSSPGSVTGAECTIWRRRAAFRGAARDRSITRSPRVPVPDKRVTIDDVVAGVQDGMTIGIGGWGAPRKPMALVRALVRSPVRDLTIVSYGGPDVGLL